MAQKPERDYSGRSLFDKLGVFARAHVAIVGRHDEIVRVELDEATRQGRVAHRCARSTI